MYPNDFPEYDGSLVDPNAYLVVVTSETEYGDKIWNTTKLSLADLHGSGGNGNTASVDKIKTNYEVPTGGVLAAYMDRHGVPRLASKSGTDSQFLIIGTDTLDFQSYQIATPGVLRLPQDGHNYIIGKVYYLGENGVPTTEPGSQKLFSVLDKNRIIVY